MTLVPVNHLERRQRTFRFPSPITETLDALRVAVFLRDTAVCRASLRFVLGRLDGGESAGCMTLEKACRAFGFELVGEDVRYRIERHKSRSWLAHTIQVRAVSLVDGSERLLSESAFPITLERIRQLARTDAAPVPTKTMRQIVIAGANHARAYTLETVKGADESVIVETFALAWVAHVARKAGLGGPWQGTTEDAFRGFGNVETAARMSTRAAELWQVSTTTDEAVPRSLAA